MAMLRALLAALFGATGGRSAALRAGVSPAALLAADAVVRDEGEAVEWVLVPAPWRAGRWWVPPYTGAREIAWVGAATAWLALSPAGQTRAPPPQFPRLSPA
ncbi:MAG: hypothetical protein NT133_23465 [Alphaproteobacteria bacterium]|nr:hypothetical protein [Alphaproteobacteria bacterium]